MGAQRGTRDDEGMTGYCHDEALNFQPDPEAIKLKRVFLRFGTGLKDRK